MSLTGTRISRGPRYRPTRLFSRKRGGSTSRPDAFGVDVIAGPKGSKSTRGVHPIARHPKRRDGLGVLNASVSNHFADGVQRVGFHYDDLVFVMGQPARC